MSSAFSYQQRGSCLPSRRRLVRFGFCLIGATLCPLALCPAIFAQSIFGTVLGTVRDPSGSVIPAAVVALVNTGTNAQSSALSNSSGGYEFVNVEIGSYRLTVFGAGLSTAGIPGI